MEVVLLVFRHFRDGISDAPGLLIQAFHVVTRLLARLRVVFGEVQVQGGGAERLPAVVVILVFLLTFIVDGLRHLKLHVRVAQATDAGR